MNRRTESRLGDEEVEVVLWQDLRDSVDHVTLALGHVQIFAYSGGPGPAWLDNNAWCFQVQVGKDEVDKFPVCSVSDTAPIFLQLMSLAN